MDPTSEDDDFQDAFETQPMPCSMDLATSIDEAKTAVRYFFNNKFQEARNIMEPWATSSMYHSVGHSVFLFMEAMLTFEQRHIQAAAEALKKCMALCNRFRRKVTISDSIGKMVKKPNYDIYSPEEIHAELCYAEALLLKSILTFVEDETLVSFIKAGLNIRSCYHSYKECLKILNSRRWAEESHKVHFEGGVRVGIGAFNLMISLLPARAIKLLEFVGFSGSKDIGLQELEAGYRLHNSLRQVLSVMTLLGYHLIVVYVLSHTSGDLKICDEILENQLTLYPHGVWFLFFKGRLEFMKGNIDEAVSWYNRSWKSQSTWPQFHHVCYWELLWANCIKLNWREASSYAELLLRESRWSRTIYSYQAAVMLLMLDSELNDDQRTEIESLMSLPGEMKFLRRRAIVIVPAVSLAGWAVDNMPEAVRAKQGKNLVLPGLELLYLWNLFKVLGKNLELAQNIYKVVEKTQEKLDHQKGQSEYDADNRGLVLLLKAASLRAMNSPLQAEECLRTVIHLEKDIKEDRYLIPYSTVELSLIYRDKGDFVKAASLLEEAKIYTGYSLESRLHFKIHAFNRELHERKKGQFGTDDGT